MKEINILIRYLFLTCLLLACITFTSCNSCTNNQNRLNNNTNSTKNITYKPQYAQGFILAENGAAKILQVTNPWQGASNTMFEYFLKPDANPKKNNEIKIPVNRAICLSSTHVALLDAIGKTDVIKGLSGTAYISNTTIQKRIADKQVVDVGYEAGLSFETVVSLQPDVIFAYGVSGELTGIVAKLNELGIKVVFLGDYLEETPLGKSEWLMAIAAFFNAEEQAKSVLEPIFASYNELSDRVKNEEKNHPKVMLNAPWKDSWFVPAGKSYMANLLKDAGADFIYADNNKRDSYPISLEKAFNDALKVDYWLNPNSLNSLAEIKQSDARLAEIPAFKKGKVYNNNARATEGGGSDFWESGIVNPHIILMDLVKIFHPQLLPNHQLYYYHHLK